MSCPVGTWTSETSCSVAHHHRRFTRPSDITSSLIILIRDGVNGRSLFVPLWVWTCSGRGWYSHHLRGGVHRHHLVSPSHTKSGSSDTGRARQPSKPPSQTNDSPDWFSESGPNVLPSVRIRWKWSGTLWPMFAIVSKLFWVNEQHWVIHSFHSSAQQWIAVGESDSFVCPLWTSRLIRIMKEKLTLETKLRLKQCFQLRDFVTLVNDYSDPSGSWQAYEWFFSSSSSSGCCRQCCLLGSWSTHGGLILNTSVNNSFYWVDSNDSVHIKELFCPLLVCSIHQMSYSDSVTHIVNHSPMNYTLECKIHFQHYESSGENNLLAGRMRHVPVFCQQSK